MRWVARRNPRLDPTLAPSEWEAARRRYWSLISLLLLSLLGLSAAGWYWYTETRDRARDLQPAQVVEAAGMALAQARQYRFVAQLTGESSDGFFPTAHMTGEYQRKPLLLHLKGEAGSGETKMPLEYYLEADRLYVKNPRSETWLVVEEADLDELYAFQPDNLAAPLVTGLKSARSVGRERLEGGEAELFIIDLDPEIMRIPTPGENERLVYRLWVYTESLRPARFRVDMDRPPEEGNSFQYQIDWDFSKMEPLAVPAEVKAAGE